MINMREFISQMSEKRISDINPQLFNRSFEPSIADYIISGLKVIESLPYIKFTYWERITDASKIDVKLNRKHLKNKAILKNKNINKIISIHDTAEEMLKLKFQIDYDGETRYIRKNLLIPAYIDDYHMLINGKEILTQKQIVDMSTYNQKKSVKLKTTLTPIDLYKIPVKDGLTSTDGNKFEIKTFILNLFTKEINPLKYYAAKFGIHKTINYFGFSNVIDVVDREWDKNIFYYFQIKDNDLYIEVDKNYFKESKFIRTFVYMIYELFGPKTTFEDIDKISYWLIQLGMIFTKNTKIQKSKGLNVLVSFDRILDDITKSTLRLDKKHLQSTHSIIRWLITNYSELRKKDNHDLELKRIRCNEVTAFYFIQSMSQRINNLLNKKKLTIESIERIFNWNPDELFKLMKSSTNTLLKYNPNINCFDLLNALRFSFLGSQGISGGKNISDNFREIHASHCGRIDLNGQSHGANTALTGFLTPRCKIYDGGFFSKESKDPDMYSKTLKKIHSKLSNKSSGGRKITDIKAELKLEKLKVIKEYETLNNVPVRNGHYLIARKNEYYNRDTHTYIIDPMKPIEGYIQKYRDEDGLYHNMKGNYLIERENNVIRNRDGIQVISRLKSNLIDRQ